MRGEQKVYTYTLVQWFLFFYIYCFLGWVWESCYVSVKQRKWINRGFMHGPFLPIYGSGAIMVLICTLPFRNNDLLVFIFGMIGATLLEYVTGATMEKIFNVRYWDYSQKPFNLKGHICLVSSLAWGLFSILMENILHQHIEVLVLGLSKELVELVTLALTIGIAIDFTQSFNEAMDLKEMLMNLTESSEELKYMKQRLESVMTTMEFEVRELYTKAGESKQLLGERFTEEKVKYEMLIKEQKQKTSQKYIGILSNITDKMNSYTEEIQLRIKEKGLEVSIEVDHLIEELRVIKQELLNQQHIVNKLDKKKYFSSIRILKRNPGAISKKYLEAFKELENWKKDK